MSTINPGDIVTVKTDPPFSNAAGTPTDPGSVRLIWRRRGGPPTTMTYPGDLAKLSAGTFQAEILITRPGTYYARWEGDGAVRAAEETTFEAVTDFPAS